MRATKAGKHLLFLLLSLYLAAPLRAGSVYDADTNTITLGLGENTLASLFQEINNPAVLSYDGVSNTYQLSANISGKQGEDADLRLENATLVINSTSTLGYVIKTWSDVSIDKMKIKAADPACLWTIWGFARWTTYSLSITDSDISGGIITAYPNGYTEPSKPTVIKNNYFHDTAVIGIVRDGYPLRFGEYVLSLMLCSENDAQVYNNTFERIYLKQGQYNGVVHFGNGHGIKVDGLIIRNCSSVSYGMVHFYGTPLKTGEVKNFEIVDNNQGFYGGKEWGNIIIRDGTIKTGGDGIHTYRRYNPEAYDKAKYWISNVSIEGAAKAITTNRWEEWNLLDIYNVKISSAQIAYTLAGNDLFFITNTLVSDCPTKYWISAGQAPPGNLAEVREYELADIYVQDLNNAPVSGAVVTISCDDPEDIPHSVNRIMPGGISIGSLGYGEGLQELTQTQTLTNGHTPLPTDDQSKTVALLRLRKTLTAEKKNYTYTVTAEKYGVKTNVTVTPEENWYRTNPDIPVKTITITLPFSQLGTVTGIVSDSQGNSLEGVKIAVVSPAVNASAVSENNGGYTLTLPVGNYSMTLSKEGYRSQNQLLEIRENQTNALNHILFLAGMKDLRVYPNPYVRGRSSENKIIFANLPPQAGIQIYAVNGQLLKNIDHRSDLDGGRGEWDVSEVGGGVYLYVINSAEGIKKGKISVIK